MTADHMPRELVASQDAPSPTGMYIDDTIPLPQLTQRYVSQIERAYLHKMLGRNHGKLIETAEAAGITRRSLYTRMKEFGLDVKDYK